MNNFRRTIIQYPMNACRPFLALLILLAASCSDPGPDMILVNGKIWTAADEGTFSEAIAIKGNEIVQVGTSSEIQKLMGSNTKTIDLMGKLVIPGFNDAHIHFLGGSQELAEVDLTGAMSGQGIANAVASFASQNTGKNWITGRGWQYIWFPSGLPTNEDLTGMISDRPVFIKAYDGHSAWANKKALELAGVTGKSKVEGFGEVVVDAKGNPTGALLEGAQSLVTAVIPKLSHDEKLNALRSGLKMAARLGITSMQNASGSMDDLDLYKELERNGELTVRYAAALSVDEETDEKEIEAYRNARKEVDASPSLIKADAIKFMLDGVIESHTAAMLENYDDLKTKGDFAIPLETYKKLVAQLDKEGFRLYTHAIGDLAVREALNAYEAAQQANGPAARRNRIEHIETISPDDLKRFAQLGVMASMEPIHADPGTMGVWGKAIGTERIPYSFAWASLLEANAHLVFSSDWPACIDVNPIRGLHVAVNRRTPEGIPEGGWIPDQRIPIGKALLAYTRAGAFASFEENRKGQLKPGMLADVVVLSQDLFTINPMEIASTKVLMTIFNGKVLYEQEK